MAPVSPSPVSPGDGHSVNTGCAQVAARGLRVGQWAREGPRVGQTPTEFCGKAF